MGMRCPLPLMIAELRIGNSSHNFTFVLLDGVELVEFTCER